MLNHSILLFECDQCEFNIVRDSLNEKSQTLQCNHEDANGKTHIFIMFSCFDIFSELVSVTFVSMRSFHYFEKNVFSLTTCHIVSSS